MLRIIFLNIILFYQKFISPFKPRCCRFYPSCSSYALMQFKKNNFFSAFLSSILRILKCNPFFMGGIDHPIITKKINSLTFCFTPYFLSKKSLFFLYVPYVKNKFYLIKVIKKDNL